MDPNVSRFWHWQPRLYTNAQLRPAEATASGEYAWRRRAVSQVGARVAEELFPCPFAKKSRQLGLQWFAFVESLQAADLDHMSSALCDYVEISARASSSVMLHMPLVMLLHPALTPSSLAGCHALSWSLLQHLHDQDATAWPADVPIDADNYLWTFCFRGTQLFVNFSAPRHLYYRSRNLGDSIALVINPRKNFDRVAGDTPSGRAVRQRIRRRLEAYDGHAAPEALGTYGTHQNREWLQYALPEPGTQPPERCPLVIRHRTDPPGV